MEFTHDGWVTKAAEAGLVSFKDATVSIKNEAGEVTEVPFQQAVFAINTADEASKLFNLAEAERKDGKANAISTAIGYAYGLGCRAAIRAASMPADPDKALKAVAKSLLKAFPKKYKTEEQALVAARAMAEEEASE